MAQIGKLSSCEPLTLKPRVARYICVHTHTHTHIYIYIYNHVVEFLWPPFGLSAHKFWRVRIYAGLEDFEVSIHGSIFRWWWVGGWHYSLVDGWTTWPCIRGLFLKEQSPVLFNTDKPWAYVMQTSKSKVKTIVIPCDEIVSSIGLTGVSNSTVCHVITSESRK